jgi:uncharacterized protein (TIGR02266 family)
MKSLLVVAGDRALTKFIAETLLGRKLERGGPSLRGNGWSIARAHSSLEGLLMITRSEQRFDAILVDQNLPDRDVLSFLDQVRKIPDASALPVFVMSERGRDQLTRKLASDAYLVTGFIDKPVTAESLRRGLRTLERLRLVLLVEHDAQLATEFERELRGGGFAVEVVSSAKEAIHQVAEARPDAVVAALSLADMPGAELCVHLKRSASTHTIPVLLHGRVEDLAKVEIQENAHRADDFLRDPVSGAALAERISALVGRGVSRIGPPPGAPTAPEIRRPGTGPATVSDQEPPGTRPPTKPPRRTSTPESPPEVFGDVERDSSTRRNLAALKAAEERKTASEKPRADPPRMIPENSPTPPPASASPSTQGPAKRSTRRVPCNLSVSFRDGETIYRSETLNISNGGILIATNHPLEIGTHIDLTLELPSTPKPITAVGKVAWIGRAPSADGASVGVGIKFSSIAPSDLKLIVDYVNSVSRVVYVAP